MTPSWRMPTKQSGIARPGSRSSPLRKQLGDVVDHRAHLGPAADLEHLERDDAAELGAAAGRHMAEAVLLQPRRRTRSDTTQQAIGYIPPVMPLPVDHACPARRRTC